MWVLDDSEVSEGMNVWVYSSAAWGWICAAPTLERSESGLDPSAEMHCASAVVKWLFRLGRKDRDVRSKVDGWVYGSLPSAKCIAGSGVGCAVTLKFPVPLAEENSHCLHYVTARDCWATVRFSSSSRPAVNPLIFQCACLNVNKFN